MPPSPPPPRTSAPATSPSADASDAAPPLAAARAPARAAAAPAPARAERADKVRNRARIVAAATQAFAETGTATQMDDVAARAGVAVGTLYRHFATKDALMTAIVEPTKRTLLDLLRQAAAREDVEPFDALAKVLVRHTELLRQDRAAKAALLGGGEAVWAGLADVVADCDATFALLVERAQAAGAVRRDVGAGDVWRAACGVVAVMDEGDAWRRHLTIVLDGIAARGGPAPARP